MIRRALVAALFLLVVVPGESSLGASPPGPRLLTVALENTKGSERDENASAPNISVTTIGPSGEKRRRMVRSKFEGKRDGMPFPFYAPSWSGDGGAIAFTGSAGKTRMIYVVSADGSGLRAVPGTENGTDPVLSPDGRTVAFSRWRAYQPSDPRPGRSNYYSSTTTWIASLDGGRPQRLTRWRDGLSNEPGSFSPDGSVLALTKKDNNLDGPEIVLLGLNGGGVKRPVPLAEEPVISPDGLKIAFIGYRNLDLVEAEEGRDYVAGELYTANIDGTGVRRLTHTDDVIESSPGWDPSGTRIAYIQFAADTSFVPGLGLLFPFGNAIMQVNGDGTCRQRIYSSRKAAFYGVAWQPGTGREAGAISC